MSFILAHPGTVLLAILSLGILIIVHEGGHYLAARASGMRVDRFSIGFGPRIFSFQRGETLFQVAAIPLGGFVQIAGLNPGEENIAVDDPRAYPNRPVLQRLVTIFAGPGTNYVFAALLMVASFLAWGVPVLGKEPIVAALVDGKPAQSAGLQLGDQILSVGGTKVTDFKQVAPLINASQGAPLQIQVLRDNQPMSIKVQAERDGSDYRIGIQLAEKEERQPASFGASLKEGLVFPVRYSAFILHGFQEIFAGRQKAEFSGPIGIVKVMQKQISHGVRSAVEIVAIISVYLGLFNLLPLPALDGGRIVFLGWELVSRRKVNQRVEQTVHMVGMFMLLGFIVFVTLGNDLGLKAVASKLFNR
jgi:regulator of sigma E protease